MTKDEALRLALEALETKGENHPRVYAAITAIKAALAQPAQGPWVGLTQEDLEFWTGELGQGELGKGVIRAVSDHLKEKNT